MKHARAAAALLVLTLACATFASSAGATVPSDVAATPVDDLLCDPIDPAACLFPFPNNHFTKADPGTATGRRLALNPLSMPRNVAGKPVDPTDMNRNDGFSPGQSIVT